MDKMIKLNWFERKFVEDVEFSQYQEHLSRQENDAREFLNKTSICKPIVAIGAISLFIKYKRSKDD